MNAARKIPLLITTILFLLDHPQAVLFADEAARMWTDASGRQIKAVLEGFQDKNTVILKMEDGRSLPYPIEKLSAEDQKFVREEFVDQPAMQNIDWDNPKQSKDYVIRGLRKDKPKGFIETEDGFVEGLECIEAKIVYRGGDDEGDAVAVAYFYDGDGKLLEAYGQPADRRDDNQRSLSVPDRLERGETYEVYFPITKSLEEKGWKTVIVLFGLDDDYSIESLPKVSFANLEFDEKVYVFPGWVPKLHDGIRRPKASD